jgi:hypothetical protein
MTAPAPDKLERAAGPRVAVVVPTNPDTLTGVLPAGENREALRAA